MKQLFQVSRRLKAFDVELVQSKVQVSGPGMETRRMYAFVKDGVQVGIPCQRESDMLTQHQIDVICRRLKIPEGAF